MERGALMASCLVTILFPLLCYILTLVRCSLTETFISGHLEVNVEFLIQIDKLVQLIESPIFTCEYTL